ncbi:acyl-CoA N-acyltransferase [soil metagenome]
MSDRDLASASALVGAAETGGFILAVESDDNSDCVAGISSSFGGFVDGVPVLCSDMLMVRSAFRDAGIGTALKRLQAALAIERGFHAITWTVDPLRASNARLNFEKLGAFSARYERNRYGNSYGSGLYGGMPSDRLHLIWPILTTRVQSILLPTPSVKRQYDQSFKRIPIPEDIDALVQHDLGAALDWRFAIRDSLENEIAEGYIVAGFESHQQSGSPALILRTDLDTFLMADERIPQ